MRYFSFLPSACTLKQNGPSFNFSMSSDVNLGVHPFVPYLRACMCINGECDDEAREGEKNEREINYCGRGSETEESETGRAKAKRVKPKRGKPKRAKPGRMKPKRGKPKRGKPKRVKPRSGRDSIGESEGAEKRWGACGGGDRGAQFVDAHTHSHT
jgi:hypothetical protein